MSIENTLAVHELGAASGLESLASITLARASPESNIREMHECALKAAKQGLKQAVISNAIGVAVTATSVALPLLFISDQETAYQISIPLGVVTGLFTVSSSLLSFPAWRRYSLLRSQKKKAGRMAEEHYVLASELENLILVPSAVEDVDFLSISARNLPYSFAVKEKRVVAPVVSLPTLGGYVGETVVIPGQITAVGDYNDMKLTGTFDGSMMFVFPIEGTIDGRVFTEEITFRIGDSSGGSVPACLGYIRSWKYALPLQLRSHSPITRHTNVSDKVQLVNFLNQSMKSDRLLFLGKLDAAGHFDVEAIANPKTKETYALAVYQPG